MITRLLARAHTLIDGVPRVVLTTHDLAAERFRAAEVRLERNTLIDALTDAATFLDAHAAAHGPGPEADNMRRHAANARRVINWCARRDQSRHVATRSTP